MALVSSQSVSPFAELNPAPYAELSNMRPSGEDSDDEYVYVSSLAEQIAHALMLDDEEEPPSRSPSTPLQQDRWHRPSLLLEQKMESIHTKVISPVSSFAAVWRDHGPSEWDCFYTPSLQQSSIQTLCPTPVGQMTSQHSHLCWKRNSVCMGNHREAATCPCKKLGLRPMDTRPTEYSGIPTARKESIGTGVFLPKIVTSGSHYRRKSGFSSSKSTYAPRHKC